MKIRKLLLICFILLSLIGCTDKAVLKITNATAYDEIWYAKNEDPVLIDSGEFVELEYDLHSSIFDIEEKKIDIEIGGRFILHEEIRKTIKAGKTTDLLIFWK